MPANRRGGLTFFCLFFLSFLFFLLVLSTLGARPDYHCQQNRRGRSATLYNSSSAHGQVGRPDPTRRGNPTYPHEPVLGLKLLLRLLVIVDQTEPGGPSTTKLGLEPESRDSALVSLVEGGELFVELGLGDGGSGGVEDVDDELTTVEETVGDELAGSHGDRAGGILWRGQREEGSVVRSGRIRGRVCAGRVGRDVAGTNAGQRGRIAGRRGRPRDEPDRVCMIETETGVACPSDQSTSQPGRATSV